MIFNAPSATATGGTLTVTAPAGVTVTVSKDGKTKTKTVNSSGIAVFKGLASGTWTVTITGDGKTAQKTVAITTDYSTAISFSTIPEFTYTGDFEIVSDDDQPITVSQDNFKIRLLTSGTLVFTSLNGAEGGIDVFLVGGGGGGKVWDDTYTGPGGGSGYTATQKSVQVAVGTLYDIVIGSGGAGGSTNQNSASMAGGATSAFGATANGGNGLAAGGLNDGAAGGSGGAGLSKTFPTNGGTDGSNGDSAYGKGGSGQGSTTREFGDPSGKLYATGGSCLSHSSGADGTANTGNGGDGGGTADGIGTGGAGGSGIVIIRNAREVA